MLSAWNTALCHQPPGSIQFSPCLVGHSADGITEALSHALGPFRLRKGLSAACQ